jgi:hypothetical protein
MEDFGEDVVRDNVNGCSGRWDSPQDAWLVAAGPSLAEYSTDDHLAEMCVLAFADRIDAATLPDETSHCGVFVPYVTKLYPGDLP